MDPPELTLTELYRTMRYQKKNRLDSGVYALAFWQRLFQPLATLIMIFLAIPFTLGPLRSVSMGLRLMVGVMVGFLFHTTNAFFGPFSLVYQLPPPLAACLPSLLFAGVGLWLTRRIG